MTAITKQEFDTLLKTKGNKVSAVGCDSNMGSSVTVISNEAGTPIAMRYSSIETNFELMHVKFKFPPIAV